jgi:hypothetical protein
MPLALLLRGRRAALFLLLLLAVLELRLGGRVEIRGDVPETLGRDVARERASFVRGVNACGVRVAQRERDVLAGVERSRRWPVTPSLARSRAAMCEAIPSGSSIRIL